MGIFTQIVILIVVLACMVMVLIAIRQLFHYEGFDDLEETSHLKEEVKKDGHIITPNNIFHTLVEVPPDEKITRKDHNSNSKDPLSPNE